MGIGIYPHTIRHASGLINGEIIVPYESLECKNAHLFQFDNSVMLGQVHRVKHMMWTDIFYYFGIETEEGVCIL